MNETDPTDPADSLTLVSIAPQMLTASQAGRLVQLSHKSIMEAANRGDLPAYSLGSRTTRFLVSEVMAWATSQAYEPGRVA